MAGKYGASGVGSGSYPPIAVPPIPANGGRFAYYMNFSISSLALIMLFLTSFSSILSKFLRDLLMVEYKGLRAAPVTTEFLSMPIFRMCTILLVDIFSPAP